MKLSNMITRNILLLIFLYGCNPNVKQKQEESIHSISPVIIDVTQVKATNTPLKLSQFADSISYISLSEFDPKSSIIETAISKVQQRKETLLPSLYQV